eukprot:6609626-Heterocapsa_arctica.AAC.1
MEMTPRARGRETQELFDVSVQNRRLQISTPIATVVDEDAETDDGGQIVSQGWPRPQTRGRRILQTPSNAIALAQLQEGERLPGGGESRTGMSLASVRRSRHTPVSTGGSEMYQPDSALDDPSSH